MRVILMANSECNAKCKHCYIPYKGKMSAEETLERVKHLQGQGHEVIVAGAETLLDTGYLKAYQQTGQDYILTNGILLSQDESLFDLLKEHGMKTIVLSLHFGIEDELKSVPESLVAKVIRESKKRDFLVKVATTITSENYKDIEKMCERSLEYGADGIDFGRFVAMGRGKDRLDLRLGEEEVAEVFRQVVEARGKYELHLKLKGYWGPRPGTKGEELAKENKYCPIGWYKVTITPDNNVYGCPLTIGAKNRIGRYVDGEIIIERDLLDGKRDTCIAHLVNP